MKSCLPGDGRLVHPVFKQIHSSSPVVTSVQHLLLDDEADYLLKKTARRMHRSEINGDDGKSRVDNIRSSSTAYLPENDPVIRCLEERLATIAGFPVEALEPLQVTAYTHGQRYKPHYDDDAGLGPERRLKTIFTYLEADDDLAAGRCGGETSFKRLLGRDGRPLKIYPRRGRALVWSNYTPDGRRDNRTLHAGEAVTCPGARKVGLNAWFLGRSTSRRRRSRPRK